MKDAKKSRHQLVSELRELRQQIADLKALEAERREAEDGQRQALTEALVATQALRENERFLQGILEAMQDGISVLDRDLNVIRVSQWMERMYADQTPLVGRKCYEVYQQRQSPCPWCPSIPTIETGEAHTEIVPYPSAEEPTGWIELSAFPLKDADDRVLSVIEYVKDITERKQAEEALQQRNQELELLNRASQALTSTLDLDQVLGTVLEEVRHLLGVVASSIWLVDPETDELICRQAAGPRSEMVRDWRLSMGEGIAGWVVLHGESVVVPDTRDDERYYPRVEQQMGIPLRSMISVPLWVKERVIGALQVLDAGVSRFDTEDLALVEPLAASAAIAIENARLHKEVLDHAQQLEQRVQERTAELQAQYARLDAILNSTTDGIVVTDATGNIIQANPVAQAWLSQTFSQRDAGRLQEAIQSLAQRAAEKPEIALELTEADLELSVAPVAEKEVQKPTAAVVDIHDVSHLKEMDRMKATFIDNISHELRTPVTTIQGYAYLLQRVSPEDEKWNRYLSTMIQEMDRQVQLVEDIVQISRIYAKRLAVEPQPTPLNELTETAVADHQTLAQERGLTLEHRPVDPGPVVLADSEQMAQVLNSLVGDAIRYTPEGRKVIVSTKMEEAEEGKERAWAKVSVSDTGEGIPAEDLPHIFERFFRKEEPRSRRVFETGLRLMTVKGIVELHGGQVTVETREGMGTTFTVRLPLAGRFSAQGPSPLCETRKWDKAR